VSRDLGSVPIRSPSRQEPRNVNRTLANRLAQPDNMDLREFGDQSKKIYDGNLHVYSKSCRSGMAEELVY
jgi:hypothetical protein